MKAKFHRAGGVLKHSVSQGKGVAMNNVADHGIRFGRIAVLLPVKNMDKAHNFYAEVLGFRKVFENGDPVVFMILKRDDAELHLTLQPDHKPAPFNVAHLLVQDVDALHAICRDHGLRIVKALEDKDSIPAPRDGKPLLPSWRGVKRNSSGGWQNGWGQLKIRYEADFHRRLRLATTQPLLWGKSRSHR